MVLNIAHCSLKMNLAATNSESRKEWFSGCSLRNCSKTVIKELLFGISAKNCVVCPKYLKNISSPFKACPNYLKLVSAFCA